MKNSLTNKAENWTSFELDAEKVDVNKFEHYAVYLNNRMLLIGIDYVIFKESHPLLKVDPTALEFFTDIKPPHIIKIIDCKMLEELARNTPMDMPPDLIIQNLGEHIFRHQYNTVRDNLNKGTVQTIEWTPLMPRNKFYCQCKLQRPVNGKENSHEIMISWIPADIAKKGNIVKLKTWPSDKEWSENWKIVEIWDKKPGADIEKYTDDWRYQRSVSDV